MLIVDDSTSMSIWRRTVAEFRELLIQLAAFRDIRTMTINTDGNVSIPALRPAPGRCLVLALTDCVGRAWTAGSLLRSLESIQRTYTVAILQMLPQRLWAGCGLSFVPAQLSRNSRTAPPRVRQRNAVRREARP